MTDRTHELIRQLLRSEKYAESGLTGQQLAILTGRHYKTVRGVLDNMPDAYIASWAKPRTGPGRHAAVWRVVVPPPHCRPPPKGRM
jgi:hypothetical protein